MRLSSSSLVMASARTSCSVKSENRFTGRPLRSLADRFMPYNDDILDDGLRINSAPSGSADCHERGQWKRRICLQRLRRMLEPIIRRVLHFYWRFSRGATLGVRALVIDGAGRVFLIK